MTAREVPTMMGTRSSSSSGGRELSVVVSLEEEVRESE